MAATELHLPWPRAGGGKEPEVGKTLVGNPVLPRLGVTSPKLKLQVMRVRCPAK